MSLWHMAWSYLWNRKLTTCLTILSVGLAVGLISAVLTLREETRKRFEEEGQAFDIVVGAKGSPLQLVLSSVYYMDTPTGNILLSDYQRIRQYDDVKTAFPISLGDTYRGYKIVGTIPDLFDHTYINPVSGEERQPFNIVEGRCFDQGCEAVLGATVARTTGLELGDTFVGTHGFMELPESMAHKHEDSPYTVVGILGASGSPNDRAIYAPLESVWDVHGHAHGDEDLAVSAHTDGAPSHDHGHEGHDDDDHKPLEITAILVSLESPALRFQFKEYVNEAYNAMAATPVEQIASLYDQLLGTAKAVLLAVGYLVVVISALSILVGLYLSIIQRKRDLAIMRALGASAYEVFGAVLIEAFWVTVLGIATGWLLGSFVAMGIGIQLAQRYGLVVSGFTLTAEMLGAFATVAVVGLLAGLVPAWQAYRTDIARDLAEL